MSGITGGASPSTLDNLSAILEFVKSPDYLDRIKELRNLEEAARRAHNDAEARIAEADAKTKELAAAQAMHDKAVARHEAMQAALTKRIAQWNQAMAGVAKAMRVEE